MILLHSFYILSANRLVKHTGYGNAAGLLLARGLLAGGVAPGSESYSSDSETSDTEEYEENKSQYVVTDIHTTICFKYSKLTASIQ